MTPPTLTDWVLLVDDDPRALEITQIILEDNGIAVHPAQTVEAALEAVRRIGPPSVILLDVMMPGANGFDVCRRLRAEGSLRHSRLVFLTALNDEASRLAALEAGADDLITKPIREPILIARIRSLLELARLRDRNQVQLEYETVVDTIGEGVIALDDNDRVLTANRPARRLLGLPDNPTKAVHLPTFLDQHWSVVRGVPGRSAQARLVRTAHLPGVAAAIDWTARELPGSAETHATWTVVVRDATDAWEHDRALGRFLRSLGHKLRTPLTGVSTTLELLSDAVDLNDEDRGLLDLARQSADRLRDTLVRILEFIDGSTSAGAESGALVEPDGVRPCVDLDDDVVLNVRLAKPVRVDAGFVRRSIAELVSNARSAGARHLSLSVDSNPDGSVTFSLTDDGRGVPIGSTERIFEPFYQLDRSGEATGAGLGLAILATGVEARGGTVGAHTPVGGPTTVWFRLPQPVSDRSSGRTD